MLPIDCVSLPGISPILISILRAGLGMNEDELRRNPVLTDVAVYDLNVDPKLPYEDNIFDVRARASTVVSVELLI